MRIRHAIIAGLALLAGRLASAGTPSAAVPDDAFLAGYAAAVLEQRLGWPAGSYTLEVSDGRVRLDGSGHADAEAAQRALATVAGVRSVRLVDSPKQARAARGRWFPTAELFRPALADPKEPRFFISPRHYDTGSENLWLVEVGYGANFPVYGRIDAAGDGWNVGISGGLFGLFNLEADSFDLINADYTVGIPFTWRQGARSARLRLYHQSSHLGDEYLLNAAPERINLSFESLEALLAYDLEPFRVYGGGEVLLHREPGDLDRLMAHAGIEYFSRQPATLLPGLRGRPFAGLDLKSFEEHDWKLDSSLKLGMQFDAPRSDHYLRLLLEGYHGYSPHGQFYSDRISYFGLGVQFGI
ncbi:DUF1207 domain-containing protein [Immundisolibacter sp.]|uniref:DUF1207 domain-containing protein n=1 Tax=Immundisolibacter sp. TaxID=1934948 RepID=UPI00261A8D10|nr:DUF1207 domain-containing protein [Immundisolibacter sp.]MDD3651988.1 DUF1207 domain-containing protein [Immundisolibacter sp.]